MVIEAANTKLQATGHLALQLCRKIPAASGAGDKKGEWCPRYDPQNSPKFVRSIQVQDTAARESEPSDYSVCAGVGESTNGQYYVIDLYGARLRYPDLKLKVRELAELHPVSAVLIENSSSGIALNQELRDEGFVRTEPVEAKGSKYERILARTDLMQAGKVWLPNQAHWFPGLIHEAVMFPTGRHDDQLDALAHALKYLAEANSLARFLAMLDELMGKNPTI